MACTMICQSSLENTMRIVASLLIAVFRSAPLAETGPKVKQAGQVRTLLYVGNSFFYFNDGVSSLVLRLVAAGDPQNRPQYRSTMVTISGSGLNWHDMESYFKPGSGMTSYSFTPDNKVMLTKFDNTFTTALWNDAPNIPL